MQKFNTFNKCIDVKSIQDINDQFDYEDIHPQGNGDSPLVSCGQDDSYNELEYIYDEKLKSFVDEEVITKQQAINALCAACHDLSTQRARNDFYKYLEKELRIKFS